MQQLHQNIWISLSDHHYYDDIAAGHWFKDLFSSNGDYTASDKTRVQRPKGKFKEQIQIQSKNTNTNTNNKYI